MAIRYVKIAMQMKFLYTKNKCFQYFIVVDNKYKKYILDNKYTINAILEKKVTQNALSLLNPGYSFISRKDEDDRITLEFSYDGDVKRYSTGYFAIVGDIPYSDGCEECKYNIDCRFCDKKEKPIEKMMKNCRFFSQKGKNE